MMPELPSPEQVLPFARSLVHESDRGCAIVGAAYLNNDLDALLRARFCHQAPSPKKDLDWLLDGPLAPLRSFGVRIRLARALGLITPIQSKSLDAIRSIRNKFAHSEGIIDIPAADVEALWEYPRHVCGDIEKTAEMERMLSHLGSLGSQRSPAHSGLRVKLILGISFLRASLHAAMWFNSQANSARE